MRHRNFRAKDLFSDDWLFKGQAVIIDKESRDQDALIVWRSHNDTHYVQKETVGELITTLNGTEHWEGDIFELKLEGIETHIEYQNAVLRYNNQVHGYGFHIVEESSGYFGWISINDRKIMSRKIIGNYYDNPELVEEKIKEKADKH